MNFSLSQTTKVGTSHYANQLFKHIGLSKLKKYK